MAQLRRKGTVTNAPDRDMPQPEGTLDVANMSSTQLYNEAAAAAFANHGARPRTRVVVPPAQVEEALQLTAQGKLTMKNAWAVRLIEGMADSVGTCLDDEADQYVQFTKAAHLVEGGAKVWTHRVDSTYLLSTQMVKRLLRNDARDDGDDDDDAPREEGTERPRRRRATLQRTVADQLEEITQEGSVPLIAAHVAAARRTGQADAAAEAAERPPPPMTGAKGALAAHGALFRAVTEKFDQGHAQGLLLNNTRIGAMGNLVLDRDFAADATAPSTAVAEASDVDIVTPVFNLTSGAAVPQRELERAATNLLSEANVAAHERHAASVAKTDDEDDDYAGAAFAPSAVGSRAPSVFSRGPPRAAGEDGPADGAGGSDGDSGHGGWDDGGASVDGDFDDAGIPEAEGARYVRDVVTGAAGLDEIDAHYDAAIHAAGNGAGIAALAAEDPNSWVPLSQHVAVRRTGLMSTIRTRVAARAGKAEQTAEEVQAAKKARRERRNVQFIGVAQPGTSELDTSAAALLPDPTLLGDPRKATVSLTPLGKKLCAGGGGESAAQYANPDVANKAAAAAGLVLPPELREPLPDWTGAKLSSDAPTVEDFFQLFSTSAEHWNLLRKTVRAGGAGYATGDDGAGQRELPFIAADHAGEFGDGDYAGDDNDGPMDDGDDFFVGLPAAGLSAAAEEQELAATPVDGDDALDLIPVPEQLQALKVQTATAPTMVDVVKLRATMWRRVGALARRPPPTPTPSASSSSSAAQAGAARDLATLLAQGGGRTMFSDVITSMLPDVPQLARDGSLSPAFFFFSLLFLANEHNLDLRQVVGDAQLQQALKGIDPAGDALGDDTAGADDDDDDVPMAAPSRFAGTAAMRRAHENHVGGQVERVGVDVVIRVPIKTEARPANTQA